MIYNKDNYAPSEAHLETPCFVLDEELLNENVCSLNQAIAKYWNNTVVGYSYKTNSLKYVIEYMKEQGFFAEVVSDDEYELAKKIGYKDDKIIYNGPIKEKESFFEALKGKAVVNIDSSEEMQWLAEINFACHIGIRVNIDLESYCLGESNSGADGGRFGFCYENGELKKSIEAVRRNKMITVSGLHMHCSTKTRSLKIYSTLCEFACKIGKEYNLALEYIDIGGGFFGGVEGKPNFEDYFSEISNILGKYYTKELKLIIEPGISLIGSPFEYHALVKDIKDTSYGRFCIIDGSRIHLDPLFHKSSYSFNLLCKKDQPIQKQVISGFTCMENDRLMVLNGLTELSVGDKIIFYKVGAYTICLSPLFIQYFPNIFVKSKLGYFKIRDKWTVDDYLQKQKGYNND